MDLRSLIKNPQQVQRARDLVTRGLLCYQPFIFSDDLQTGVGYEFCTSQENVGLVYWPTIPPDLAASPGLKRLMIQPGLGQEFAAANQRLRQTYDYFIDEICRHIGDVSRTTFADVGCNSGYFPLSFASRGALRAVGFDREDYSGTLSLLNDILGIRAQFVHRPYRDAGENQPPLETFDVAISMMVLCHLSDTLRHLAFLGSLARRAIFIWTLIADDDDYCIRFGQPNKYYHADPFPLCFDNMVCPSAPLLRRSLELMGFTQQHVLPIPAQGVPARFYGTRNLAILALR